MGGCTEDGDEAEAQQQAKDNPEMTTAEIEATVALMKGQGIVDLGEAVTAGTGALRRSGPGDWGICGSGTLGL